MAAAAAVIVLILPLALSVRWVRGQHASSTSPPAVASADEVRVVHWVGTQIIHGQVLPMEMTIAYPDQERTTLNGDTTITDWGAGYDLNIRARPISYSWHPTPFRFIRSRVAGGITRAGNGYTLAGRMSGFESTGAKLLRHTESKLANGDERHELEYQLEEAPWAPYTLTLEVDPRTDLILAWDETNHATDESGQRYSWRVVADRVEYNVKLPPDYFSTEPPPGEEVMDYSTPEGLKRIFMGALVEVEKLSPDPERQRALVAEINRAHLFDSTRLSELAPHDRQAVLVKLAAFGVERDGRPAVAPPLTKEQNEGIGPAEAVARKLAEEAQVHAKALAAEQAALKARAQKIGAESEAQRAALQRAQKALAAAQAAAKQGGEEARIRLKEAEAKADEAARQVSALFAERARVEAKRAQLEKEARVATARLGAAAARLAEAQRAREAAEEAGRKK